MTAVDKPAEPEAHADPNDDAAVGEDNGTDCVETPEDPKDAAVKKTQHAMELWAKDTPTQGSSAVPTPLDPLEAAAKEKEEWTNEWTESSPLDDEQPANDNPPPAVVAATAEIEEEVMQAKIESGGAVRPTSTAMSTDGDEQEAERGEAVDAVDQVMRDKLAGNVAYDATSSAASVAGSAPRAQSEIASCSANSPLAASPVREAAPAEDSVMQHRLATGGAPLQQQPSSAVSVAGGSSSAPREASEGVSVHSPVEECSPAREGAPVEDALMQHKLATGGANQQSSSSTESVLGSNHPAVSEGTSVHSPVVPESPAHEPAAEEASGMGLREKLAGGGGGDVQHSASTVSNANSSSTAHRGDVSPTPPGASGPNPSETSQFLPPASPVCEEPDLAEEEVMRLKIAAGGHSHPASSSTQSIDGSAAATDGRTPARGSAPSDNRLHSPPGTFESPFPEQASDAPVLGSDAGSSYLPPAEPTCDEPDAVEEEIMKRKFEDGAFGPPATSTVLSVDGSTRGLESPAGSRLGAGGGPDGRTLSTMSVDGSVAAERERDCADDPRLARLEAEKPGRTLSTMSVDGSVADNAEGATGAGDPFGSQLPQGPSAVPVPRLDRLGKPEGVRTLSTASIDGSAVDGEPKADLPDEDPKLDGEEPSTASPRVTAPLPSKPEDPSAPAQGHPAPAVTNPRAGSAAAGPPQPPSAMPHKKIYREKTPAARPPRSPTDPSASGEVGAVADEKRERARQLFAVAYEEGNRCLKERKFDEAERFYQEALAIEPAPSKPVVSSLLANYALLLQNKSLVEGLAGENAITRKAEDLYLEAVETDPNNSDAMANYALLLNYIIRDYDKAEEYYLKSIKINPNKAGVLYNYAILLENVRKQPAQAEQYYLKAVDKDPTNPVILCNYGLLLYNTGNFYKAEAYYTMAIDQDPKYATALGNYALLLENIRHDYDAAEKYYKLAIESQPNNANALGNYGLMLYQVRRDTKNAEIMYRDAIRANPKNANALFNYAVLLEDTRKDFNNAQAYYIMALDTAPNDPVIRNAYANFLRNIRHDEDQARHYAVAPEQSQKAVTSS